LRPIWTRTFPWRKRLQRATKPLTKTADLSVKEVAIVSSFADPNSFAEGFRRFFGANPLNSAPRNVRERSSS
jgi:transcriptional regulator GlxA family with amidase domain